MDRGKRSFAGHFQMIAEAKNRILHEPGIRWTGSWRKCRF